MQMVSAPGDPKTWNGGIHPQILKRRTAERRRERGGEGERQRERQRQRQRDRDRETETETEGEGEGEMTPQGSIAASRFGAGVQSRRGPKPL